MNAEQKCEVVIKALDSKKGLDIQLIKVSDITSLAEYFVIATGTSSTQVRALAEEAEFQLSQAGVEPHHVEGKRTGWFLLDYGDVVVHVFDEQARSFYDLERLWADGESVDIAAYLS